MMNMLEEAIIYATVLYQGKVRKVESVPYILHPMEVAQILSTMTDDPEVITAGILHDVVEDTDGTLDEIEKRFGKRVAYLVENETEKKYPYEDRKETWIQRKEEALLILKENQDIGVKMLWLADKLSNIRSIARIYSERGSEVWNAFNQTDPSRHCWYFKRVAELVEIDLNKTGAFKELIKHINFIWPGTFDTDKARYRKYREVSLEGCDLIAHGAKGDVYRYDAELIIKVYNEKNTYHEIEEEISKSRKAFILGLPTAISFGIVSVGSHYGSMYELVNSDTLSRFIERDPEQIESYAKIMADLAHMIHSIRVSEDDGFPPANARIEDYITYGVGAVDDALANKYKNLLYALPETDTLIHGDFHTGNVFLHNGEPLLIDLDRVSTGHPIIELSDFYYFYVQLGEDDPLDVENFMGFSYETALRFADLFFRYYLDTEDEKRIQEVKEKASLIGYSRLIRKIRRSRVPKEVQRVKINALAEKISHLLEKLDTLTF